MSNEKNIKGANVKKPYVEKSYFCNEFFSLMILKEYRILFDNIKKIHRHFRADTYAQRLHPHFRHRPHPHSHSRHDPHLHPHSMVITRTLILTLVINCTLTLVTFIPARKCRVTIKKTTEKD
jgi:hypothetical protein